MLRHECSKENMKTPTNPVIYWRIKELAVTARVPVRDLLREAGISAATVHGWTHKGVTPSDRSVVRLMSAADRLRERLMG
jgi:hypothetical protein